MFATDTKENRKHRAVFGEFLQTCRVIEPQDWVLTTHTSGFLYRYVDTSIANMCGFNILHRSLDLISEICENAGASVLCAGSRMEAAEVVHALINYRVNVLTGDSTQIINIVHHISTLPAEQRSEIGITKVMYTSDLMTASQRAYISKTLGAVKIVSILGSAEAGPYAISNPDLTGHCTCSSRDFVFDTRAMLIEIFHPSAVDEGSSAQFGGKPLPEGEQGIIVQTSLQRLRNPLVRYITGDVGSIHAMPKAAAGIIPESELKHLRVLRLGGRDRRFSFKWYGEYFNFDEIENLMQTEGSGVLQWQVVLDSFDSSPQSTLEVRMLRAAAGEGVLETETFVDMINTFFYVFPENQHLFKVNFLDSLEGFEKSSTGNKIIKFVNRFD
jgi:phenylacetate-coenzyme A ligase PaaK-like adenylate-forming protein